MNEPGPVTGEESRALRPVFVSYASADRKEALSVCKAIERRGMQCWISTRDVEPGANYQEEIVHAIREARAMVLVFSEAANNSDEIKKELSLASRNHVPVMAVRIEDVEPSDAFAYELSTRQWIDAFEGWDKSIDSLVRKIRNVGEASERVLPADVRPAQRHRVASTSRGPRLLAGLAIVLGIGGIAGWQFLKPTGPAAHTMQVRLAGFQLLSPDLPAGMPQALDDEINAAFNDDGVVAVSTAPAPPPGNSPAYAMGGTIRREGDKIKVIVRLTNERSGTTLWSNDFTYDAALAPRVPHLAAVYSGMIVRCGLFGASTYPKPLTDNALIPYLGFCQRQDGPDWSESLKFAQKTVAVAPDFSWGWSGVETAAMAGWLDSKNSDEALHRQALDAADRAIKIDPSNSEAYAYKAAVIDKGDLVGQEALLKQALSARPLPCGCEHHIYGEFLRETGRLNDSVAQFRRGIAVLPLNAATQDSLGNVLLYAGDLEGAKKAFDAAADLDSDATLRDKLRVREAPYRSDYSGALKIVADPKLSEPQNFKDAIGAALQAIASGSADAKAKAAQQLSAMPMIDQELQLNLLALLGAQSTVLQKIETDPSGFSRGALWSPSMHSALSDPSFPAVAGRLGLMRYWKTTHTKPDICSDKAAPPFCRMI